MVATVLMSMTLALPAVAHAQFGGLFNDALRGARQSSPGPSTANTSSSKGGCDATAPKSRGSRIFGNMLGGVASRTVGRTGIGYYVPIPEVSGILTDAIACKLEPAEQKQAATATMSATRGGKVGSSASWNSSARDGVSGTSTVIAKTADAGGTSCMTVNDVVIVNGEETTVSKRMCRARGSSGYTLAA